MNQEFPYFKCGCCGQCCHDVIPWTIQDLVRLSESGLLEDMEFCEYFPPGWDRPKYYFEAKHREYMMSRRSIDDDSGPEQKCSFLGDDNKCIIYEYRPEVCRDYSNANFKSITDPLGCQGFAESLKIPEHTRYLAYRWEFAAGNKGRERGEGAV